MSLPKMHSKGVTALLYEHMMENIRKRSKTYKNCIEIFENRIETIEKSIETIEKSIKIFKKI